MNKSLFTKLAIDGIKKNKKLYFPYILSIVGMVMIYYILSYLVSSPALNVMGGGSNMKIIMSLGKIVMIVFSVLFLAYTNSFLAKRRNKEFALYNILGMNKKNVLRIVGRETVIVGVISILGGLFVGFLFSKLFEIALLKACGYATSTVIHFSFKDALQTVIFYVAILVVLYFVTGARIITNKPIELLHSTNAGEKEPKANIVLACIGAAILIGAYTIAIKINNPISAIGYFFIAVVMVIVATYLLFVAGSVFVCKVLKKNKNYYYNPRHYVSVSGMLYRMKRNGAGLASICILSTMILVMLSSAGCLYFGKGDSMASLYPNDIEVNARDFSLEKVSGEYEEELNEVVDEFLKDVEITKLQRYHNVTLFVILNDGNVTMSDANGYNEENFLELSVVSLEEYNKYAGENGIVKLQDDEILLSDFTGDVKTEKLQIGEDSYKVIGKADSRIQIVSGDIVNTGIVITTDLEKFMDSVLKISEFSDQYRYYYNIRFDVEGDNDVKMALAAKMEEVIEGRNLATVSCRATDVAVFFELYGGLFVLGIFLSIAFSLACVLIMYYKQITEGYEDSHNYDVMQKVGMTKEEIKAGINSQTLITFFSPLAMAGLHLVFSFPMVSKMLMIFGIFNKIFLMEIYVIIYILFGLLYLFVYKKTVKSYVEIVA